MKIENVVLMHNAREALNGNWGLAIAACIIYTLISGGFPMVGFILSGPMATGMAIFSLKYARRDRPELSQIFEGFNNFLNSLAAFLLMAVYIILWSLLLIVPGIIAAISYSQTFFILAEDRNIGPDDAINKSKKMMNGYKWKYFRLCLRFFGWGILCVFTLGIGFFWLVPWMQVTFAMFYDDIKNEAESER